MVGNDGPQKFSWFHEAILIINVETSNSGWQAGQCSKLWTLAPSAYNSPCGFLLEQACRHPVTVGDAPSQHSSPSDLEQVRVGALRRWLRKYGAEAIMVKAPGNIHLPWLKIWRGRPMAEPHQSSERSQLTSSYRQMKGGYFPYPDVAPSLGVCPQKVILSMPSNYFFEHVIDSIDVLFKHVFKPLAWRRSTSTICQANPSQNNISSDWALGFSCLFSSLTSCQVETF